MNTRQKYELRLLAEQGCFGLEGVSSDFDVSLRLIRYDVENLNQILGTPGIPEPIQVRHKTAIISDEIPKSLLVRICSTGESDFYQNPPSAHERVLMSVADLCWQDGITTIQELADKYCVSRNTINRDMRQIKDYCSEVGVTLIAQRGEGIKVEASENARRKCLSKVMRDYREIAGGHQNFTSDYARWFDCAELEKIKGIISDIEIETSLYLDDISYEAVVIHIALSIVRSREGQDIASDSALVESNATVSIQNKMAARVIERINEEFKIELPKQENEYIAAHINTRFTEAAAGTEFPSAVLEFACIELIASVSEAVGRDLTHDYHLYRSLVEHLRACVYRKSEGLLLENPLRESLLQEYQDLCVIIRTALSQNAICDAIVLSDDEVSYIMMHFAAAMQRQPEETGRKANVVIVCATGFGTAELLAMDVKRYFNVNILAKTPSHLIQALEAENKGIEADLIISTVPLESKMPYVAVRPLLQEEDIAEIDFSLRRLGFNPDKPYVSPAGMGEVARDVMEVVGQLSSTSDEKELVNKLQTYLSAYNAQNSERTYMFSELLDNGHVLLDAECDDWRGAVYASGKPLLDAGDITQEYIDAVIKNIEEIGPYVVITKGVALPHATNKVGVNRTAMSCVRLKTPVNFHNEDNDPVEFCFMLAAPNPTSHLEALRCFAELLSTPDFLDFLREVTNEQDVVDYIKNFESENAVA